MCIQDVYIFGPMLIKFKENEITLVYTYVTISFIPHVVIICGMC